MLKKTILALLLFPASSLLFSFSKSTAPEQQVLKTIIIDAGHGITEKGNYNGARGKYSYEDDICLDVSKKLVALLKQEFPDVRIVETRPDKNIVGLHKRADMANEEKGDIFISIHVNAMPPIQKKELIGYRTKTYYSKGKKKTRKVPRYRYYEVPNTKVKGTQTYIWGAHKGDDKETAVRENAPMLAEENYKEKYGDIDVNSPEFIALSLVKTQQFARRSSQFANMVETEFEKAGRVSGGSRQRQAGIWVLQATAMPSVLVETGFITNPDEEDYLNSEKGQQEIAQCITNALKNYKDWLEKKQLPTEGNTQLPKPSGDKAKATYNFLNAIEQEEKLRQGR